MAAIYKVAQLRTRVAHPNHLEEVHRDSVTRNLMTIFRSEAVTNVAVQLQNPKRCDSLRGGRLDSLLVAFGIASFPWDDNLVQ